jgi:2-polyprenyl-3-methyl-5-hydroxy-6-metoxy-1,4-benzoquinol methylase
MNATFWDRRAERYDRNIRAHDGAFERTIARTRALLFPDDRVLDFGCASGEHALAIAPHVGQLHGIDLAPQMVAMASHKARREGLANATFACGTLGDAALTSASFSAVLAFNVLHLVADPDASLSSLYDLLDEGGMLITQTPCLKQRSGAMRSAVGLLQLLRLAPPIAEFEYGELARRARHTGFEVMEVAEWDSDNAVEWVVARKRRR